MRRWSRRSIIAGAAASLACGPGAKAAVPALRRGINLWPWFALTREFPAPRSDYAWPPWQMQRPVPRQADLQKLAAAGLDFVRLPVDPGPFLAFAGAQRQTLLDELFRAVANCQASGLAVVVNIQANEATHYWNSARMHATVDAERFGDYRGLVADIAAGLARFDPARTLLEPVNEPPGECAGSAWPKAQNALLAAARAAAPALPLVATGGCGSMIRGLEALDPAGIPVAGPLLYTFHFYEPYLFTHQGAPWMREPVYRALNSVPWPGAAGELETTLNAVRQRMEREGGINPVVYAETGRVLKEYFDAQPDRRFVAGYFAKVMAWATRHNIPARQILVGEFGALRTDSRYTAAAVHDRARYIRDVREVAEGCGFAWSFWNLFDGMGLMDDATRELDPAIVEALGLVMPKF